MKNALFFICLLGAAPLFSQNNYNKQFRTAFTNWDTSAIVPLLKKWELEAPNDPNLFIARANYYLQASKKEIIRMDAAPGKGENFEILDSTGGKPVAYMYSDVLYTDSLFELSQQALDEGIRQYPNRLDMRFGKIYTLGERGLYKRQTNAIIDACRYGKTIDYAWHWTDDNVVKDSKKFFTENVQDYMNGFFEADQPEALILVSQEMLLSFPNDPIYHANLGTGYIMQGKTAEALAEYEAAYSLNKKDVIIVSNLAHTYAEMGQKEKAIDYYKKILKFGNAGEKRYAEEQIRELKEE